MFFENRPHGMDRMTLAAVLLAMLGCGSGSGSSAAGAIDYPKVRAMANIYSGYLGEHRDQPPANEQTFREYLTTKQDNLDRSGLTIDQMFVSPRGSGPLMWVYGGTIPTGPLGTYFAYEQTPVDGTRLVIANLGMYEELDEAKFRATFPNSP
jgi:hypothetical protein